MLGSVVFGFQSKRLRRRGQSSFQTEKPPRAGRPQEPPRRLARTLDEADFTVDFTKNLVGTLLGLTRAILEDRLHLLFVLDQFVVTLLDGLKRGDDDIGHFLLQITIALALE